MTRRSRFTERAGDRDSAGTSTVRLPAARDHVAAGRYRHELLEPLRLYREGGAFVAAAVASG